MIVKGDLALVHTPGGNIYVLIEDIRTHGQHKLYDVVFKSNGNTIRYTLPEEDIIEEAYKWVDVSHITDRHPKEEEKENLPNFIRTATEISALRRANPKFRVRLVSMIDTYAEKDRLRKLVFEDQDQYEKYLGLEDREDAYLKKEEDPLDKLVKRKTSMRLRQQRQSLYSSECHTFGCEHCKDKHCIHPSLKVDVNRCSKHTEPHNEEFTNPGAEEQFIHMGNDPDQLK